MDREWLLIPDDVTLAKIDGWQPLAGNRYRGVRCHLLIVKRKETHTVKGPVIDEVSMPSNSEFTFEQKRTFATKYIETFTDTIQRTATDKLTSEVSTKLSAEIGPNVASLIGKVGGETQSKLGTEFTESLATSVSDLRSFEVASAEEIRRAISIKPAATGAMVNLGEETKYIFYLRLWVQHWDIYLYKVEAVDLIYRREWFFWQVRDSIRPATAELKLPLARLTFYDPVDGGPSIAQNTYEPEVQDPYRVEIGAAVGDCPKANGDGRPALEDYVRLAFPVTPEEKQKSKAIRAVSPKTNKKKPIDRVYDQVTKTKGGGAAKGGGGKRGVGKGGASAVGRTSKSVTRASKPSASAKTGRAKTAAKGASRKSSGRSSAKGMAKGRRR